MVSALVSDKEQFIEDVAEYAYNATVMKVLEKVIEGCSENLNHKLIAFFAKTMYYTLRKNDTGERIR